jgi:pimeloyl-ACP methyl ester carboxylesterase
MYDLWDAQASKQPLLFMLAKRWPSLLNHNAIFDVPARLDPGLRWASANGMWVFGARTRRELLAAIRRYSLKDVAGRIACPTLILHGERDHFIPPQQATAFYAALNCPKTLRMFNADDGAEEHCQIGNLSRMHQVAFDWLDEVFEVAGRSGSPRVDPLVARATNMLEVVQP